MAICEIDDLLQEFVATKFLEQDLLSRATPTRGRFRTLLLTSLDRFAIDQHRREFALKRGRAATMTLDDAVSGHHAAAFGGSDFEVEFAREVIAAALARTESYCHQTDQTVAWEIFRRQVVDPLLRGESRVPYADLVQELGLVSPAQASNQLTSAKRIFRRCLRQAFLDFGTPETELDEELRALGFNLRSVDC